MGIYLVDYENVHNDGVTNIKMLKETDHVIIFYGDSIRSIPFDTHVEMMASKAKIEYIETHKTAKNYLDFQLATYLGYLIGQGEKGPVYLITNDTGYDSIVDFWTERNLIICRCPSIAVSDGKAGNEPPSVKKKKKKKKKSPVISKQKEQPMASENKEKPKIPETAAQSRKLPENFRKKLRTVLKEEKLPAGKYTSIYKAVDECPSKLELNNTLIKAFDNNQGSSIYNRIKKIYEESQTAKQAE